MGFFDKLFGKKKDEKADKKPEPQEVKKAEKKVEKKEPSKVQKPQQPAPKQQLLPQEPNEDDWIYELVLQYLISPIWKVTISEFLDEHCIIFDEEEENKFSYYDLHKKFKKMMENLVDGMVEEIGITEEQFGTVVEKGLKSQQHRKYFEQLLIIDNFLVFKKLMIKRNKSNELEALKELQNQDAQKAKQHGGVVNPGAHTKQIKKLELEKEKADLEHALAMSKAVEDERNKMMENEEQEFMEAIKQSELEYKKQQQSQLRQDVPKQQVGKPVVYEEEQVVVFDEGFQQQEQQPSLMQFYGGEETKSEVRKSPQKLAPLPQIQQYQPKQIDSLIIDNDQYVVAQDRNVIQAQIEKIRLQQEENNQVEEQAEQVESTEDRKKRLLEQRDLIRKKKQAEREKELQQYQESQQQPVQSKPDGSNDFIEQQQKATTDLQRRKDLLEQKKKQLLMNKIKEDVNKEQL